MGTFFKVNPTVVAGWLAIAVGSLSTAAYYYDKVYGWQGAEAVAFSKLAESEFQGAPHHSTSDYGDVVRVVFSKPQDNHFIVIQVSKDGRGKWAVNQFDKDYVPWEKREQASR